MPIGALDDLSVRPWIEPMRRESEAHDHLLRSGMPDLWILANVANQLHAIDGGIINAMGRPILGLKPGRLVHRSIRPSRLT
jgi:hypothetical protein